MKNSSYYIGPAGDWTHNLPLTVRQHDQGVLRANHSATAAVLYGSPQVSYGARWLSGRMPDSQSSEPGFESPFGTVSKIGHFRSLHWWPSWLSCLNEYLAIDSGGNVNDLFFAGNCSIARMLPGGAENGVGMNRSARGGKKCEELWGDYLETKS